MDDPALDPDDRLPAAGARDVSLTTRDGGPGLVVVDHVERHRFELWTDDDVTPEPADCNRFYFPTDAAVAVRTGAVTVPTFVQTYVRDADGEMVTAVEGGTDVSLGPGTYDVEVCAPMKIYLRAEGPLEVTADALGVRIALDAEGRVLVGGRSHHDRPAATVTTTSEPRDVMAALSSFGSALKTTSPERSFPTLRGHPPLVELGEALDVPRGLEPPDTGVRIVVPPDLASIYVATPLAYYLGAELVPGSTPRLVADSGVDMSLESPTVERSVRETLERVFLLDCLVRTEGYYPVELHERNALERRLHLDFRGLYDLPPADRLAAYLDVPYEAIADLVPDWGVTTHVAPVAKHVEVLPFLADDLAVVRTPAATPAAPPSAQAAATSTFFRRSRESDADTRAAAGASAGASSSYIRPEQTGALEQVWVGRGTPLGATKAIPEAYHNRLGRSPVEDDIRITVVCNDRAMAAESDVVDEMYGADVELPFDVAVREGLTRAELREALVRDADFLHYVGHIDERGMECVDGWLDAGSVERVGVDAFLLNACQSFEQGADLVRAGAVAGIVTLNDVVNDGAVRMGRLLARLLNHGFPLTGALDVAAEAHPVGDQYGIVGDGNLTLARTHGSTPNSPVVVNVEDDSYELELHAYPTNRVTTGSMIQPYLNDRDTYYLFSSVIDTFELTEADLEEFLSMETVPVRIDGDLYWSDDLSLDDLSLDDP